MLRDIVNKLSGGQITMIILALILVPGAVGAAVTFQPVAIVDPTSGRPSYIDSGRRLYVYDPVAGYRNNPANIVEINFRNSGTRCEGVAYTVPSGKVLILTNITGNAQYDDLQYAEFLVIDGGNCSGRVLTSLRSSVSPTSPATPVALDMGGGIVVQPGRTISLYSYHDKGFTSLHGYLAPASAAPAASSAQQCLTTEAMGVKP
jgi:hypothetical protein